MPIVNIDLAWLNRLLGKPFPTETLRESLEQIGCDVEDVAEVAYMFASFPTNALTGQSLIVSHGWAME